MQKLVKAVFVLLGVVVVVGVLETALMFWAWRSRNHRALHLIKRFNKCVLNPLVLRFSGRPGSPAIVHHVGRRSGKPYATPVVAHQTDHGLIIPLPYGTDVDWLRNLLAAKQAVVDLESRSMTVDEPAVVDIDTVIDLLPARIARTARFNGSREAVQLQVAEPTVGQ